MGQVVSLTKFYKELDAEKRIVVKQRTGEIKTLMRRSAQDIIDIGNKLIEVKEMLGHGNFGEWLEAEFAWSQDTAGRFMNVAKNFNEIPHGADFEARTLYLLASPSTPESARDEVLYHAEAGEKITHTTAKQIVAVHKLPPIRYSNDSEFNQDAVERPEIQPNAWYPTDLKLRTVINLPIVATTIIDAFNALPERYHRNSLRRGATLTSDPQFATYQWLADVDEDLTPIIQPMAVPSAPAPTASAPALRYKPGMKAECPHPHCLTTDGKNVYDNWTATDQPGIWACPKGHRRADALMRLVEVPAPTAPAISEADAAFAAIVGEDEPTSPPTPPATACDECGTFAETVYKDFRRNLWLCGPCGQAHIAANAKAEQDAPWVKREMYYAVRYANGQITIYDDPFPSRAEALVYYPVGYQIARAVATGNPFPFYANYEVKPSERIEVPAAEPVVPAAPVKLADQPSPDEDSDDDDDTQEVDVAADPRNAPYTDTPLSRWERQAVAAVSERRAEIETGNGNHKPKTNRSDSAFDRCQTPAYALDPLLPFLKPDWTIWEPACGEGLLEEALVMGREAPVISGDILTGQDFFQHTPVDHWDALVTNPPYSIKYDWLERCYALGKPFALLVPIDTLAAAQAQVLLQKHGFEMMLLDQRVDFKMPFSGFGGAGAQFSVIWLCWHILPQQVMFGSFREQKQEFKAALREAKTT